MTQYTLRNVPTEVDKALREAAQAADKSLNQMAIEILQRALGVAGPRTRRRDLSDLAGTWKSDPATEAALEDQRRVDLEDWR